MRSGGTYGKGAKGKADRLFSLIVRSDGICRSCGDRDYRKLQCAHIIPRTFSATRTDEANAMCLCWSCHRRYTDDPFAWVSFVDATIGREEYDRLKTKAREGVGTKVDWESEAMRLTVAWKRIEAAA